MNLLKRTSAVRRGAVAGIASRVATIGSNLVAFPLLLHHLGTSTFGVWATITSLTGLLAFADLGLGTATVNQVTEADAAADDDAMRSILASSYALLAVIGLLIAVVGVAICATQDVAGLVGGENGVARPGLIVFFVGFGIAVPLSVVTRAQTGLRQSGLAYLWVGAGALLGLAGVVGCVVAGAGLVPCVAATVAGPVVALAINTVVFFRARPALVPRAPDVSLDRAKRLLPAGFAFFLQQAAIAIGYQSDAIVVNRVLGTTAVAAYVLPAKLYFLGPVLVTFALLPLWPELRHAVASRDVRFARRACRRMFGFVTVVSVPGTVLLVVLGGPIVSTWSGHEIHLTLRDSLLFSAWTLSACYSTAFGFMLTGLGAHRAIAVTNVSMAAVNLPLSIVLAGWVGVAGVAGATAVANTCCITLPSALVVLRRLRELERTSRWSPS